jgi:hypothetical protein
MGTAPSFMERLNNIRNIQEKGFESIIIERGEILRKQIEAIQCISDRTLQVSGICLNDALIEDLLKGLFTDEVIRIVPCGLYPVSPKDIANIYCLRTFAKQGTIDVIWGRHPGSYLISVLVDKDDESKYNYTVYVSLISEKE